MTKRSTKKSIETYYLAPSYYGKYTDKLVVNGIYCPVEGFPRNDVEEARTICIEDLYQAFKLRMQEEAKCE